MNSLLYFALVLMRKEINYLIKYDQKRKGRQKEREIDDMITDLLLK